MNPAFDKKEQMLLDHYCKKSLLEFLTNMTFTLF